LAKTYKDILEDEAKGDHDAATTPWCGKQTDPEGKISNKNVIIGFLAEEFFHQCHEVFYDALVIMSSPIMLMSV
jgi:hypothetical protein